eukprot:gene34136-biopygen15828
MATIQAELAVEDENIETRRTWLPAGHVRCVHQAALRLTPRSSEDLLLLQAFAYAVIAFVTFGRPDTGTSLSRQHVQCGSDFSVVLLKEKGRRHLRTKRRLCIPWRGVARLRELVLHWQQHRDAAWSKSTRTQPDSYWLLPEDPKNIKASGANDWISQALSELGLRPPEGDGHRLESDDLNDRLVRLENSIHGVYTLLCNRFTVLQLRASLDGEGASKADAESLRAKLKFVEDCVYQSSEGLVTDSLLKEYLDEFDKGKNKAAMYANMKHAALVETGNTRGGGRGAGAGWRDEKKEQSPAGGKGKGKDRGNPTGNTGADA